MCVCVCRLSIHCVDCRRVCESEHVYPLAFVAFFLWRNKRPIFIVKIHHGATLPSRKSRLSAARMSGAVVDLVCSDQLSRGLRAWQARSRHATGERIGDCDLMRSTSASCARQRWSGNARSMTSVKRAAGTALSVVVVLFDHHKSLRNHRDTRTLEQFAILSRTISVRHERRTSTQREAGRTRANQSPVEKCTSRMFMKWSCLKTT